MLVISLTSIPPRFGQLPGVLTALLAQGADQVALVLPRRFARFETAALPALPEGATRVETEADLGPAGKLLASARAFPGADVLACDDDWLYAPGWTDAFRAARAAHGPEAVIAGASWPTERIGRAGGTVAQGFAGVMLAADLAARIPAPPPEAWAVDDIWLSGHFAAMGLAVHPAPGARGLMTPLASPGALQDSTPRDAANRAAAALVHRLHGVWPVR
jgi:hypothetical protein